MPKLVKLDRVIEDNWQFLENDMAGTELSPLTLVPLSLYLERESVRNTDCGVWLASDEDVHSLAPFLETVTVIALNFLAFADGRSFSQARTLRDVLDYQGEIRATGAFIQDQAHYLMRCGFSEFSLPDEADTESFQESLKDFSESYQAACDVAEPLFRRRA